MSGSIKEHEAARATVRFAPFDDSAQACLQFQAKGCSQHHRDHGEPVIQPEPLFWLAKIQRVIARPCFSPWFNGPTAMAMQRSLKTDGKTLSWCSSVLLGLFQVASDECQQVRGRLVAGGRQRFNVSRCPQQTVRSMSELFSPAGGGASAPCSTSDSPPLVHRW